MQKWAYIDKTEKEVGEDNAVRSLVTIIADTVEDIPDPDPSWLPGSIVLVADTHGYYLLNTEGEWT